MVPIRISKINNSFQNIIKMMTNKTSMGRFSILAAFMLCLCHAPVSAQLADKAAAQAMVAKGIAAIQADGWKALVAMTAPRKTFVDRDLYLAVYDMTGKCMAHGQNPKQVAKNLLSVKDPEGKQFVRERVTLAQTQASFWQEYKFTNPVTKAVQSKLAYCERVNDLIVCGGIYK